MSLTQMETAEGAHEKLDEQFLEAIAEHCRAYYSSDARKMFPKGNLPENQELTLLLEKIRQTNDINAKNEKGNTLLMLVAYTNEREFLELLLSHPTIDINIENPRGQTAIRMVCSKGQNMMPMITPFLNSPHIKVDDALEMARGYHANGFSDFTEVIASLEAKQKEQKTSEGVMNTTQDAVITIQEVTSTTSAQVAMIAELSGDMENGTFRIDSTTWSPIILEDTEGNSLNAKINQEGDVWELENGVQLFTPAAMFRETKNAGREEDIVTKEQAQWLMLNPDAISEDIKYAGYLNSKDGKIHCKKKYSVPLINGDDAISFQPKTAHFWIRPTFGSMQGAIQVDDLSSLEKESQSYFVAHAHKVTSSIHDMTSASQVLLLKKKTA